MPKLIVSADALQGLEESEIRSIMDQYKPFIMESIVQPSFLGVDKIEFRAELAPKGGFQIVCETNKAMNERSQQSIKQLTRGFIGGWKAGLKRGYDTAPAERWARES